MTSVVIPPVAANSSTQTSTNSMYPLEQALKQLKPLFDNAGASLEDFVALIAAGDLDQVASTLLSLRQEKTAVIGSEFTLAVKEADQEHEAKMHEMIVALYRNLAKLYSQLVDAKGVGGAAQVFADSRALKVMVELFEAAPSFTWADLEEKLEPPFSKAHDAESQDDHGLLSRLGETLSSLKDFVLVSVLAFSQYVAQQARSLLAQTPFRGLLADCHMLTALAGQEHPIPTA